MGFRRVLALMMSALLLLSPVMSVAEEYAYSAGELTATAIADSYYGGYQINTQFGFDVDTKALSDASERMKAAAVLLDKAQVTLSFYDDFGTARIRAAVSLDGVEAVSGDVLVFEDGSVQMLTSLTDSIAFTLPAGTVTEDGIHLPAVEAWIRDEYAQTSAFEKVKSMTPDMISTILNLLLGWVAGAQMETGELYTFDYDTYIDATDTRDAVASRMIGKIRSQDLVRFMWNIVTHIRDKEHEFESALAMCIGELGVTRYEGRQIIDALFPDEVVDPEYYYVQPSSEIPDDPAPFMYDDLRYLLSKLDLSLYDGFAGDEVMDTESSMIVSYDDYGEMVGFDAELAQFSKAFPYEGNFTYSVKTDDDWQRKHLSHGELQVCDNQRVIGDLDIQFGEDVDGVNASHLRGQIDLVNQESGESTGLGVDGMLTFALTPEGDGESIEANADVLLNTDGESRPLVNTDFQAVSRLTDLGLTLTGVLDITVSGLPGTRVNMSVDVAEYDEAPFVGGQAVDLSAEVTQEQLEGIKDTVKQEAAAVAVKFALKPSVTGNVLKLLEGLDE